MTEHLNEVVLQSLIAALVVEALLRLWDVTSPHQRLAARFGSLVLPVVLFPLFELLAPFRHEAWFEDGPALIATRHFSAFTVGGVGLDAWVGWPAWALGVVLLARDVVPLFTAPRRVERVSEAEASAFKAVVAEAAAAAGFAPPRVVVVDTPTPVLLCAGALRPRLLVSPALLSLLDPGELRGAVAHELSHVRWRDVAASWVLLAVRALMPFNPVTQVLGRTVAWETELRADADAARWTGRPATLASALLKVYGTEGGLPAGKLGLSARLERARAFAIEARCRRLLDAPPVAAPEPLPLHFAVAAAGLAALLFFVT